MIPFDFDYYQPASAEEAVELYLSLQAQGKRPFYYAGGTELITLGRLSEVYTEAVIDIKGVPECTALQPGQEELAMGAALTLSGLREANVFPLLGQTAGEIADHTARNKITLGGNVCGRIYYREAALPLLLSDTEAVIAGKAGRRRVSLRAVFDGRPRLEEGELILQFITPAEYLALPFYNVKKRRQWDVGYPLLTVAALKQGEAIRVAFSGLCADPFRSEQMENCLNDRGLPVEARIEAALEHLPAPVLGDAEGSPEYRLFVLKHTLTDVLQTLEGGSHAHS